MNLLQLLGLARLPAEADQLIPPQDRSIVYEHLWCSITLVNFSSPNRVCRWKRQWFAGSFAISQDRLIAFRGWRRMINLSFDDPRFREVMFSLDRQTLIIEHDASLFRDDWSGSIEYRFRIPDVLPVVEQLERVTVVAQSTMGVDFSEGS
ncbi:hypothetical protein [Roseiconus lacunae]|uniref:Uncharacterized protein n=1 Tax=Roseiconus lacunae TaxID=2605694 RepID=A0ABT7PHF2_9BACT|nr:hypothetical protein [Roseiconus lacunae]MCD0461170.1 hypothetical protein [Roseiconus lacunae]MDM4015932.1 hypothetical protein [Roseiconus lacunae]WRQ51730.1 hypothetical protein U8335_04125 [Stieleria sp. HD01]